MYKYIFIKIELYKELFFEMYIEFNRIPQKQFWSSISMLLLDFV